MDGGARERRLVAALQRHALARLVHGAASSRWSTGGPVAAAVARLPFVASRTVGALERPLLLDVADLLAARLWDEAVTLTVVERHADQLAAAEEVAQVAQVEAPETAAADVASARSTKRRKY